MTAERPKCIDGERCRYAFNPEIGYLRATGFHGFECWHYDVQLRRHGHVMPTRCAACRRDFPNEEVPK